MDLDWFCISRVLIVIVYCNKVKLKLLFYTAIPPVHDLLAAFYDLHLACDPIRTDLRPTSLKLWRVSHLMNVAFVRPALCFSPSSCASVTALKCQRTPEGPALLTHVRNRAAYHFALQLHSSSQICSSFSMQCIWRKLVVHLL